MADADSRRYRFGPLERRGVVGGLRGTQVTIVAATLTGAVVLLHVSSGGPLGIAAIPVALLGLVIALYPFAGRTLEQWLPVASRWAVRRTEGRLRYRSTAPTGGARATPDGLEPPVSLPAELAGTEILSAPPNITILLMAASKAMAAPPRGVSPDGAAGPLFHTPDW